MATQAHEPTIQQLFEETPTSSSQSSSALPDISLRPNSSAHGSRVRSASARRLPTANAPATSAHGTHGSSAVGGHSSTAAQAPPKRDVPLTAAQALAKYGRFLTGFEKEEILAYPQVYFVGSKARKIHGSENKGNNFGYDDESGRYKCIKHDHVGYRYEILRGLGKGSFGDVIKTFDHKTQKHQAVKIIRNQPRFHKQGQVEVRILEQLKRHDRRGSHNFIHINDWFVFRNHLCITFDLMHHDLYSALKKDNFKGFKMSQVRSFATSLLSCLRLLRRQKIIHCDLKPENILLTDSTGDMIRVIDFGSACFENQTVHSYIQSRFYRAPEIILGQSYNAAIDMWSLGCILIELYTAHPVFPGKDEKEQLMYIMEVIGVPPANILRESKRANIFFDSSGNPRHTVDRKGRTRVPGSKALAAVANSSDAAFLSFLEGCLHWDPSQRMTPKEASKHPWITGSSSQSEASAASSTRSSSSRSRVTAPQATIAGPPTSALHTVVTVPAASGTSMRQ